MPWRDYQVMSQRSGPSAGVLVTGPSLSVTPGGGLSSAEAAARLARYGPNKLPRARRTPLWRLIASQLRDPLVIVLLVAAVLTLATGDWTDAGVILLVIVVNTTAGLTQEVKAGQAIAALSELTAPEARVLRDGAQRTIPATEVVAGDVLVLAEGDIVPADADVTAAAALLVDESALTGESVPADKAAGRHAVSAGTTIVRGRGRPGAGRGGGGAVRRRAGHRPGPGAERGADGGHRDQPGGRRRPGIPARGGHPGAGAGRAPDVRPPCAHQAAAGGRDAGVGDRPRH